MPYGLDFHYGTVMNEQQQRRAWWIIHRWMVQDNIEALEVPDKLREETRMFIASVPEPKLPESLDIHSGG